MKLELKDAFRNQRLIESEVAGRGEDVKHLEFLWNMFISGVIFILFIPMTWMYLESCSKKEVVSKALDIAEGSVVKTNRLLINVTDDELDITPKKTYDTLHYPLSQQVEAIKAAWAYNVPMVMVYDSNKKLVGYDVKYETRIIQE